LEEIIRDGRDYVGDDNRIQVVKMEVFSQGVDTAKIDQHGGDADKAVDGEMF
jgi:hypothetical protein